MISIPEQQNVDIDRARAFLLDALAAQARSISSNAMHQLRGSERCLQRDSAVQKVRLLRKFDRLSFIKRRDCLDPPDRFQLGNRLAQIRFAVPDVRSQRKINQIDHLT